MVVRRKSLKLQWITDYLLIIDGLQITYRLQIYRYKWLTTANGYMRLPFDTKMTVTQNSKLLQITSYIISVYVPMFVKIHLNPRASEGPTNMIFLRYLSLDFRQQHTNLVDHCVKPVFLKHFCSWMNPINVTLNIHSTSPAFQAKQ